MKRTALVFTLILNWTILFAQTNSNYYLKTDEKLIASLKNQFVFTEYDRAKIVMRFNRDTILIVGYFSQSDVFGSPKNAVYRTINGGRIWNKFKFNGDASIYCSHYEKDGKIWMGGSDEFIHFSNDYGATWIKLAKPFKPNDRVLSIYMNDSINGIAGGLSNGLAITYDNWKTTIQIPSPLDQNKFTILKISARNNIDKIAFLDSIIFINQNDHIYYSKINPIAWKEFNIPVSNFSLDKINKEWSITSIGNKVYVLTSKLDLIKTYTEAPEYNIFSGSVKTSISLGDFFDSESMALNIKAVKYDFVSMSGGCMRHPIYHENINVLNVNDTIKISNLNGILSENNIYNKAPFQTFIFTEEDIASYETFYNQTKKKRNEVKYWGGDFTSILNIDCDNFLNPKQTLTNLNQSLIDSVYKTIMFNAFLRENNEPYIILSLVNSKSDTLKITSQNTTLFGLPWTILYHGKDFLTYDTRITYFLSTLLPNNFNYYDKLEAGELIFKLVEQRTINELEYKNGYK